MKDRQAFSLVILIIVLTLIIMGLVMASMVLDTLHPAEQEASASASFGETDAFGVGVQDTVFDDGTGAEPEAEAEYAASFMDNGSDFEQYLVGESDEMMVDNPILDSEALEAAMSNYKIKKGTNAYRALERINVVYSDQISTRQRKTPLVFLFEGAGSDDSASLRLDAMCVVVQNGQVTYVSFNCTTIPDYPFKPSSNDGSDVPTICSGIYEFSACNHKGRYAALQIVDDRVIRFASQSSFYESTSGAIQVHRRGHNGVLPLSQTAANSVGCCLVGVKGTGSADEYARFIQTIGLVDAGASGTATYKHDVSGLVIIDRALGQDYLKNVGYSEEALALIG